MDKVRKLPTMKQMLKLEYDKSEIDKLKRSGAVVLREKGCTRLENCYDVYGIHVLEDIVLKETSVYKRMKPYFASKKFYNLNPIAKDKVFKSVEKMQQKIPGKILIKPSGSELSVMAVPLRGPLDERTVKYLTNIETLAYLANTRI